MVLGDLGSVWLTAASTFPPSFLSAQPRLRIPGKPAHLPRPSPGFTWMLSGGSGALEGGSVGAWAEYMSDPVQGRGDGDCMC